MVDWENDIGANEFMRGVFESLNANENLRGLPCDHALIAAIMARADVVYASWPDPANPIGIGMFEVKADCTTDFVRIQAVPCADNAAARRLREVYNGRPSRVN